MQKRKKMKLLSSDLKIRIRQYVKMALQNVLLPVVYNIAKHQGIERGLVVFADAHNQKVPSSMAPLAREIKRRGHMHVIEIYDDYQNIPFTRLLRRMLYASDLMEHRNLFMFVHPLWQYTAQLYALNFTITPILGHDGW